MHTNTTMDPALAGNTQSSAWKAWVGAALNFFLLGPGYLLFTPRKVLGLFLTIGAIAATYVEQVVLASMDNQVGFQVMFVGFFCLAIGCTIDGYQQIKATTNGD